MKKIFPLFMVAVVVMTLFGFCSNGFLSASALEMGKEAKVIASRCEVYEEADFSSNKIMINSGEEEKIYYLLLGDVVAVIEEEGDFIKVRAEDDVEGFVYRYYLTQNSSQVVYPVFNGTIRNDTVLYDMDLEASRHVVKKGDRVFIYKAYSEKKDYTAVQVVLEDQSLYNGYVLTKDVDADGISGLLIAGISIIIAAVTVVLSIVFIKKTKRKSSKKSK